ncbi:SpoIIE family protein phosphatase [Streptomyces sp. HNM0663]|uniref:SpoIIE family protein phosphatase n=1 Tax=Streptomyces chengmaiensis TaxID=3040919 RepID=A0ABT6HRT0_9ACTN|nr:SpoIIE family protein phosphatase/ATP-binding protein [Streptomyces chengmaiensis]MDH2391433.1 SpoIIE family protein phosphatase [Streptomyces chengmaiensis]
MKQSRTKGLFGRIRSIPGVRTVAGQVFVLQIAIVLLLVVAAVVALLLQSRNDVNMAARDRSVAVAETFAQSPGIQTALKSPDPTQVLQPIADNVVRTANVDFLVVTDTNAIRYTHPIPDRIGKQFVGNIQPALDGEVVVEWITGTIGPLVQAIVPVTEDDGTVIGTVTSGVTVENVTGRANEQLPVVVGAGGAALVLATGGAALISTRLRRQTHGLGPTEMTRMYDHHDAVLHAVREGVIIVDGERRLVLVNDEARRLLGLPPGAEGRRVAEYDLSPPIAELLESGRSVTDEVYPAGDLLLAVNQRATGESGGPPGSVATLRDTTELRELSGRADVAHARLRLLYQAGLKIGSTLDVVQTAGELTDFAVPRFADFATVDLLERILTGDEPIATGRNSYPMRRVALSGVRSDPPIYPEGSLINFVSATPQATGFHRGRAILEADLGAYAGWQEQDPVRARRMVHYGLHSMISVPLRARGDVLGVVTFWRSRTPQPFDQDDVSVAEELVARAALAVDNARRYTREHTMAVTLQRSLLPSVLPQQRALDVAHRYMPAHAAVGGVGGDWFDVIPLSGARVAMVVGDVVGHGLHAAATMGRLRTAVHNFAALDLSPDELLWNLDELVTRIDQDEAGGARAAMTGATCLYMIYDPVSRRCTMARAGHLEPALVSPDGGVEFPELPGGPPLGLGGMPFETTELELPEGSRLVLFTDGLIESRERDIDTGLELLRRALATAPPTPEGTCGAVLDALLPDQPTDDVALLVARTMVLAEDQVADWDVASDPSAVRTMREAVTEKLAAWGLDELAFTTELVLSELITNAIRYTSGPIRVRLIRDRTLICEVWDSSSTSPHLRHAATMDEGGRGLFLVAQFADRWGTRYTADGKIIWAEQPLPEE